MANLKPIVVPASGTRTLFMPLFYRPTAAIPRTGDGGAVVHVLAFYPAAPIAMLLPIIVYHCLPTCQGAQMLSALNPTGLVRPP